MRDYVFIPVQLIKDANNNGWSRSLSYFIKLKALHWNNTHYGFSLRSLGSKIKCSPACLSFHLKVLEQKGLIKYHSKNITFIGLKKLQSIYGFKNVGVPVDFKNQNDILRGQIIRFNLNQQTNRIKRSGLQNGINNFVSTGFKEKTNSSYEGLSAKGLGNLFLLSMASGSRLRKKLSRIGIIKCKRMYSCIYSNISLSDFNNMRNNFLIPSYSLLNNGNVLIERRSSMEYLSSY